MPGANTTSTLLVALAAMLWGSDLLLRPQVLMAGWSPARVVLGEHLLLTLAFSVVLWRGRKALASLTPRQRGALLFVAWGGSALATWLYTQSFTLGSPLTSVLLQKTQPVFALLLAGPLLGERRQAGFWGWCLLALTGAYLLTGIESLPRLSDVHTRQALFALGAAALWGGATVAGRALTARLSPTLLAGARFALAVPVVALMTFLPFSAPPQTGPPAHVLLLLLLIVLLPDLLGMSLYYRGLRGTPASVATLAELCYPLTALLIGLLLQHAALSQEQGIGLGVLVIAVLGLSRAPGVAVDQERHELQPAALS